jgi:23S rRNA pseudouridine1911/1915/1917 synthase
MTAPGRDLPPPAAPGELLAWLLVALQPTNRTRVKELLRSGRVEVNGVSVTRHDHPVSPADRVRVLRDPPPARDPRLAGLSIAYEDDAVIVLDKPSGLLTVAASPTDPTPSACSILNDAMQARHAGRVFVVHRLDRGTSGLLMFARTLELRERIQASWETVSKTYLAVVEGVPDPPAGVIDNFLTEGADLTVRASRTERPGSKRALSRYRVVSTRGRCSLVEVSIETGRKHQIRVHMAGLGCPVVGDKRYAATFNPAGRLALHAWKLAFDHPTTGKRVELNSPLPAVLRRLVEGPAHGDQLDAHRRRRPDSE